MPTTSAPSQGSRKPVIPRRKSEGSALLRNSPQTFEISAGGAQQPLLPTTGSTIKQAISPGVWEASATAHQIV